ncbi:hypothetical protein QBC44DRAFT_321933 [Cladorrhinum sp. PSN332]|nr:hypothetical protein QBC44DRAFT_321933 [Cladorrhinum sp. PSN332]
MEEWIYVFISLVLLMNDSIFIFFRMELGWRSVGFLMIMMAMMMMMLMRRRETEVSVE